MVSRDAVFGCSILWLLRTLFFVARDVVFGC